jgi:uncharacterized membrane protein YbhN (UPF0104 family)
MDDVTRASRVRHFRSAHAVALPSPLAMAAPLGIAAVLGVGALLYLEKSEDANEAIAAALVGVPWLSLTAAACLTALAAIHFLSAAWALRAVSGRPLALRPTAFAQVAAAATNRIVPSGIGGAGLNLRYLLRAGVSPGAAASGLTALAVVGGLTDAGYVAAVTGLGPVVGLAGATRELSTLTASGVHAGQQHLGIFVTAALLILVVVYARARHVGRVRVAAAGREALAHARELASHPGRIGAAALASTATTVAMSLAFVLAVDVWGQAPTPLPAGALVAVYLVAAAAGGATPLPSFFFVTELALIAALVLAGYSSGSALLAVVVFRVVTYWLPLPVGVWMGHRLRRTQLL